MKPIKLLAISASPRKDGNTEFLMDKALETVNASPYDVQLMRYSFLGKRVQPCIGCLKCYDNGGACILKDDFEELRQMWITADAVIYCVPVYVFGIPGQLKCFLDRLHNAFVGYYPTRSTRFLKAVTCISQGADLFGGQELAMIDIMRHAALIKCLYVSPDASYVGAGGWAAGSDKDCLAEKERRETDDYVVTVRNARSAVQRAVQIAAIIKAGVQSQREILLKDPKYTDFIKRMDQQS